MNFASLPMYDFPELAGVTNAWWAGLSNHMRREGVKDVPDALYRRINDLSGHWQSSQLLFSQTCGYPLTHSLRSKVTLLGLPVYACRGCDTDGFYAALLVVPASSNILSLSECRGTRAVYNTSDSMSGLLALRHAAASAAQTGNDNGKTDAFFETLYRSGGHRQSLRAVADGEAQVASIDPVSFALLSRIEPDLVSGVRVMGESARVPGLPYITRNSRQSEEAERLQTALRAAFNDDSLHDIRAELLLSGVAFPDPKNYDMILDIEAGVDQFNLAE